MSKLAVLGYGVVGSGVVELFYKNKESILKKVGKDADIKYILDIRDFPDSPYKEKFTKDINDILGDDEVTIVAECMGGATFAYDFVKSCLMKGKSVSTSNKELVAAKGAELLAIAKEKGCNFFFEASVGGAIPIIRPLHKCLAANDITQIAGILNGTTNFILGKMINEKMDFDDALKMAQELGYAEKDPTADVEGHDACRKICILSSLVFGKHVYPENVYTKGITKVSLEDVTLAGKFGAAVKLIASVKKLSDGRILPSVMPTLVPYDNLISRVDDVFNAVMVFGDGIDRAMFYGRGAGMLPTASAVLGDVIEQLKTEGKTDLAQTWQDSEDVSFIADYKENECRMYFRISGTQEPGIENIEVIDNSSDFTFVTEKITVAKAEEIATSLEKSGVEVKAMMPVLEV
ncbi:MAG: homoserine dehydrogenase [Oscillospiraceae bacterium]|nr:homoserine dehydrogenase [Oscillospiraceae bacterium]